MEQVFAGQIAIFANSGRIVAAWMKRMAATNSPQAPPGTAQSAVLLHRTNEVCTAGRFEPATLPKHRAQRPLVYSHQRNQERTRQVQEFGCQAFHVGFFSHARERCSFRLMILPVNETSERRNSTSPGGDSVRAKQTTSSSGSSCCDRRNASRNSRFHRFRSTAPPTRLEIASPSRECPSSFAAPWSVSHWSDAELRAANTRAKSSGRKSRTRFGNRCSPITHQ